MPRYLSGFMQVYYRIEDLPAFKNAVITIGTFDGVHHGHQTIIDALTQKARAIGGESVIITFDPHPRKIVQPDHSLQLINTLPEKISLLEKKGIDNLVVVPFTKEFAQLNARDYIEQFLVRSFSPACIIIGYDHHFGKNRAGNFALLDKEKNKWNYELIEIPKHVLAEIAVSSTKIRTALSNSDISTANRLLGYSYFFSGRVIKGDQIGRTLGYPTANLEYLDEDKIRLGSGVYAVTAMVNGLEKKGMLSIGTRPTLKDSITRTEVFLFDFDQTIYGEIMQVYVHHFLRHQEKFDSLEELKKQMEQDGARAIELLA